MVSGHLQIKKGYYYAVLSYYDNRGKRHVKYVATGLPEKGNKRRAETVLVKIRNEFEPPVHVDELRSDMLFADYLLEWLQIVKMRVKITTYGSYEQMTKQTIHFDLEPLYTPITAQTTSDLRMVFMFPALPALPYVSLPPKLTTASSFTTLLP